MFQKVWFNILSLIKRLGEVYKIDFLVCKNYSLITDM